MPIVALTPGTRLGPYEVSAQIGAGGMGEVYRARDTRLDRIVAIKVSKESFSERFDREARAVATLNHPRICTLFDVGPDYLVMEYVEGTPLEGPIPLERALAYGAQICEALDAAHRKGITHRDLKPGNILITKGGIKLLDFGLAKVGTAVLSDEAAMTRAVTQQGQILGTLHYMSPEQLQGRETGPSSDIFAFGLVLFEMLTGKRAFDGSSPASVIAAILERPTPSIAEVAPPALDRVLRRCLEKDPERRWQSAADLKAELDWIASGGEVPAVVATAARKSIWPWALAGALSVALGVALWAPWRAPAITPTYTFSIYPTEDARFNGGPFISPDGTRVAVTSVVNALGEIQIRHLDSGVVQPITRGVVPSWSPDGRFLAFADQRELELKRVDVAGGLPIKVANLQAGNLPPFIAWGSQDVILYSGGDGLYAVPASGGQSRRVTERISTGPQFLPDGKHFLHWNSPSGVSTQNGTVYAGSIDLPPEQNNTTVLSNTSAAVYAHDTRGREYLLFVRNDTLMAQAFDATELATTGDPIVVASQILMMGPIPAVSVSRTGVLAYSPDATSGASTVQLAWFDRAGKRLTNVGPPGFYREFTLSRDDSQVALSWTDRGSTNIFLMDAKSETSRPARLTFERTSDRSPVWAPDSTRVLFTKAASGIFEKSVSGAGAEKLLTKPGERSSDWSQNGRTIVYSVGGDIMLLSDSKASRFTQTDFVESDGHLSPDGTLLAYTSNDSKNVYDIWVESVPAGSKWQPSQPSPGGGFQPRWRSDGRELFYIRFADAKLMAVPVRPGPRFDPPVELFTVSTVGLDRGLGVSADGQRFLLPSFSPGPPSPITVITSWVPSR